MKLALLALAVALSGCDQRPNQWDAVVYPDADDLTRFTRLDGFKTFEQCQQAAITVLRSGPDPDAGDYECGYKCSYDPDFGASICKETRK